MPLKDFIPGTTVGGGGGGPAGPAFDNGSPLGQWVLGANGNPAIDGAGTFGTSVIQGTTLLIHDIDNDAGDRGAVLNGLTQGDVIHIVNGASSKWGVYTVKEIADFTTFVSIEVEVGSSQGTTWSAAEEVRITYFDADAIAVNERWLTDATRSEWTLESTGGGAPLSARFRTDNSDPTLVTEISIHDTSSDDGDASAKLASVAVGHTIHLFDQDSPGIYGVYRVTGVTDNTTYYTFDVVAEEGGGTLSGIPTFEFHFLETSDPAPPAQSAVLYDNTVKGHDTSLHAETFFHFPGNNDWTDELGNLTISDECNGCRTQDVTPGLSATAFDAMFRDAESNYLQTPVGEFDYGAPATDKGLGNFTWAYLFRVANYQHKEGLTGNYMCSIKNATLGASFGITVTNAVSPGMYWEPSTSIVGTIPTDDSEWHHICVTMTGTPSTSDWTVTLYIDGVQSAQGTSLPEMNITREDLLLNIGSFDGRVNFDSGGYIIKSMIGIRKALSGAEVLTLANDALTRQGDGQTIDAIGAAMHMTPSNLILKAGGADGEISYWKNAATSLAKGKGFQGRASYEPKKRTVSGVDCALMHLSSDGLTDKEFQCSEGDQAGFSKTSSFGGGVNAALDGVGYHAFVLCRFGAITRDVSEQPRLRHQILGFGSALVWSIGAYDDAGTDYFYHFINTQSTGDVEMAVAATGLLDTWVLLEAYGNIGGGAPKEIGFRVNSGSYQTTPLTGYGADLMNANIGGILSVGGIGAFGAWDSGNSNYIAEVAIFPRKLTASEVNTVRTEIVGRQSYGLTL